MGLPLRSLIGGLFYLFYFIYYLPNYIVSYPTIVQTTQAAVIQVRFSAIEAVVGSILGEDLYRSISHHVSISFFIQN